MFHLSFATVRVMPELRKSGDAVSVTGKLIWLSA